MAKKKKTVGKARSAVANRKAGSATAARSAQTGSITSKKSAAKPATRKATGSSKRSKSAVKVTSSSPARKTSAPVVQPPLTFKDATTVTRPPLRDEQRIPPTPAQLRKVKTGLSRKDLNHYRDLLLEKRSEILGDVESMETDARSDSGDHLSPEHMADIGSNNYEQEFTLGLVASERRLLAEIDEALHRINDGTYGVCVETGTPIARPRLDAKPWAKYCIEVALEKERRGEQ